MGCRLQRVRSSQPHHRHQSKHRHLGHVVINATDWDQSSLRISVWWFHSRSSRPLPFLDVQTHFSKFSADRPRSVWQCGWQLMFPVPFCGWIDRDVQLMGQSCPHAQRTEGCRCCHAGPNDPFTSFKSSSVRIRRWPFLSLQQLYATLQRA